MTDEQLIEYIATKVMGFEKETYKIHLGYGLLGHEEWCWRKPDGKRVSHHYNPVLNPADCAGVKAKWLENPRHEYTIKAYWLETGKTYGVELLNWPLDDTAVPARWLGRSGTEEHAFCLAVKAAWEAKK